MKQKLTISDYVMFNELTYAEQLEFWDTNQISFEDDYYIIDNDHFLNIAPHIVEYVELYNRWVVNHYRISLQSGLFDFGPQSLGARFRSFEELKQYFKEQDVNLNPEERIELIESEIRFIVDFLKKRPISAKILSFVHHSINSSRERDIYTVKQDLDDLKQIAKAVDLAFYRVFLRREKKSIQDAPRRIMNYNMKLLSDDKIKWLFDKLIAEKFIHPDTRNEVFFKVFKNEKISPEEKVMWIDDKDAVNKRVRKYTLLLLMDAIIDKVNEQNKFIIEYFQVNELIPETIIQERKNHVFTTAILTSLRAKKRNSSRITLINSIAKYL